MEDQLNPVGQNEQNVGLNIKDLFYKYVRFIPLFIVSIALSLLVAYVYLRYATLIYTSTGSLVIQDDKGSSGGNDKIDVLLQNDSKKNIQNEIEYLQSRPMMDRVVRALDLNFTYLAKGNIKELNIYKSGPFRIEAFEIYDSAGFTLKLNFENDHDFRVNSSRQTFTFGQIFKNEYGVFRIQRNRNQAPVGDEYKLIWQPTPVVASNLTSNLTVSPKAGTGILILKLEATNPQLAADVINQLMIEYQKATIDDKNAETQNRLIFIDRELDTVAKQIDSISNVRLGFIKVHRAFDPEAQSSNLLSRIDDANKERMLQQTMLRKTYQIETDILSGKNSVPVPSSLGLEDPTLNKLVEAYNTTQLEKKTLLEAAPGQNIAIQQKDEILDQLQRNILKNLNSIKASYGSVIGQIQSDIGGAQAELGLMPEVMRKLTEISRQLDGKLEIYKSLLVKREETAISLASTISDIKVLQDALVSNVPVKPNRKNIQLLAALIGLVIPALFIFFLEVLNDKVSTRYDVERLTSAPIIGEVGHSYNDETLVVTANNRGVVAEQFRIIRSNL